MSLSRPETLLRRPPREIPALFCNDHPPPRFLRPISFRSSAFSGRNLQLTGPTKVLPVLKAMISETPSAVSDTEILFSETFPLRRTNTVEGKVFVKIDRLDDDGTRLRLVVGCNFEGKWIMHWGVTYSGDLSRWEVKRTPKVSFHLANLRLQSISNVQDTR
ncbi:hypothetical protein KSP40_PGU021673 [Platanthera guangdongensis]|uniref:Uncharacterized protein n=1 Tax=Platanthera guangdongensis TaxID=2320717 RepID=A0ABR2M5W8_9ASPA